VITRASLAASGPTRPGVATPRRWVGRWRASLMVALALAAAHPAQVAAGQRSKVHVVIVESEAWVILNAYVRDDPTEIAGLLIERLPSKIPRDSARYSYSTTFYAVEVSDSLRRLLSLSGDPLLARVAQEAKAHPDIAGAAVGDGRDPAQRPPLQRPEWEQLFVDLKARIGDSDGQLVVDTVPQALRSVIRDEIEDLFRQRNPNPVLPHLRWGVVMLSNPSDTVVDFGTVRVGKRETRTLRIRNAGLVRADFTIVAPEDTSFTIAEDTPRSLGAGDSVDVTMQVLPGRLNLSPARLLIRGVGTTIASVNAKMNVEVTEGNSFPWKWIAGAVALLLAVLAVGTKRRRQRTGRLFRAINDGLREPGPEGATVLVVSASARELARRLETLSGKLDSAGAVQAKYDDLRSRLNALLPEAGVDEGHLDDEALLGRAAAALSGTRALDAKVGELFPTLAQTDPTQREALANAVQKLHDEHQELSGHLSRTRDELHREQTSRVQAETLYAESTQKVAGLEEERGVLLEDLKSSRDAQERIAGERTVLDARLLQLNADHALATQKLGELGQQRSDLAEMLRLSPEATYPEIQRRLSELSAGLRPAYIRNFEQLVVDLQAIFLRIQQQARAGEVGRAASAILVGATGLGGVRLLLDHLRDPHKVLELLGIRRVSELADLDRDTFFDRVLSTGFGTIVDDVTRLSLYARIRRPGLDVAQKLEGEGIDPHLLDRAFGLIEQRLEVDFGVRLRTVRLFEEQFQDGQHASSEFSVIESILPYVGTVLGKLERDTIYDITSVGYSSARVNVQPSVSYKMR